MLDLTSAVKKFQARLREINRMDDAKYFRAIDWLHDQPTPLSKEVERGLLRLFREVVIPHRDRPISDFFKHIPVVGDENCLKQFAVQRTLGRGSYGKVYLVRDRSNKQMYALKEIDLQSLGPRYAPKMQNEVNLTRLAGEDGIGPKVYDAYLCQDRLYIRMEYLEGEPLEAWTETRILSEEDRKNLLGAVKRLHKLGIAHQDLHSGNILVQEGLDGKLVFRIIDYGFAEKCDTMMKTERAQVTNMLQEMAERTEDIMRRWALYRMIADGDIRVPIQTMPSPGRTPRSRSRKTRSSSSQP